MVNLLYHKRTAENEVFEAGTRMMLVEAGATQLTALLWNQATKAVDGIEVFTGITDWESDFPVMLQQSQLLNLRDLETEAFLNTERILPVPAVFFEKELARQQLSVLFPDIREELHFGGDVMSAHDMVMCWEAPAIWVEMLRNHFKILRCKSLASMLVQSAGSERKDIPEGLLVIADPWAWIVFGRSGKLLHIKALPMQYPDDITYNLMSLGKHWGVEPSQTIWKVAGLLEKDSTLWKSPDRFFEKLQLWESAGQADDIPGHFFAHYLHYLSSR